MAKEDNAVASVAPVQLTSQQKDMCKQACELARASALRAQRASTDPELAKIHQERYNRYDALVALFR